MITLLSCQSLEGGPLSEGQLPSFWHCQVAASKEGEIPMSCARMRYLQGTAADYARYICIVI